MALSLSSFLYSAVLLFPAFCKAATVSYDFNITWSSANPDGQFERSVMSINGQWPIPTIRANVGDNVIVKAYNGLGNVTTSLHFHGMFQNGTTDMDGPAAVTQCGIPPGSSLTYNFTIIQPGTYWYHSHVRMQYGDGLRGPLIISDPDDPFKDDFDEEHVVTFGDWYHQLPSSLFPGFLTYKNPTGAEPVPESALINDTQDLGINVQPGKTYKFRIINMSTFSGFYVWFDNHDMSIVEVDGVYTDPASTTMIYLSAAQRYSVLVTAKNTTDTNYAITGSMDTSLFDTLPDTTNLNVTGWLVYDDSAAKDPAPLLDEFEPFDDFTLVPYDKAALYATPDTTITLALSMNNLGDGANYAFFNEYTYVDPKVPTLYTVLSTGENATDPAIYGDGVVPYVLERNEVVEIIVNSLDGGKHPLHLHGHNFQVIVRSGESEDPITYTDNTTLPSTPMRRDTVVVQPNGYVVLRFVADNPGIWLFHCHIDWHMASGLAITMIEAPLDIQKTLIIPDDHYEVCKKQGIQIIGNAAGNTEDYSDLTGANYPPAPPAAGFTSRGIVALVFSCIAAFVGMAVIVWYGFQPLGAVTQAAADRQIGEADLRSDSDSVVPVSHAPKISTA